MPYVNRADWENGQGAFSGGHMGAAMSNPSAATDPRDLRIMQLQNSAGQQAQLIQQLQAALAKVLAEKDHLLRVIDQIQRGGQAAAGPGVPAANLTVPMRVVRRPRGSAVAVPVAAQAVAAGEAVAGDAVEVEGVAVHPKGNFVVPEDEFADDEA